MSLIDSLPRVGAPKLPWVDGLIPWIVPLAIILVWQLACVTGFVSARVLPAPSDVALAGWKLLLSGELARNIWVSFWRASVGFLIGGSIGFAFGLANGLSQLSAKQAVGKRSEEHTSELQSPYDLVCRLLLEKKK